MRLLDSLAVTSELDEVFSDAPLLTAMLKFEVALARAEAKLGIIPQAAAEVIASSTVARFNPSELARQVPGSATLSIPFVKALTAQVRERNSEAAGFVHWGATSQDLADTAFLLLLKQTQPLLNRDLERLEGSLRSLSDKHSGSVMLGRTLLQAAPPVTFGLKAAGWFAALKRCHERLTGSFTEALALQFGGASGTLASLGSKGLAVAEELSADLGLRLPEAPWHTHRDRLASLAASCGILTGCLGKIARDISLLMQTEIAEAAEPAGEGRGGSSTMPHKRNPAGCTAVLAAATRVPGLVAAFLSGMVQEHERAAGAWQAEWPTMAALIQSTGMAAASLAEVAEGLTVNPERMRSNIDATQGAIFAEKASMLLGAKLGRDATHKLLEEATRRAMAGERHLAEVLAEMPEVTRYLDAAALGKLESPEDYLGSAEDFRLRLLAATELPSSQQKKD